MIPDQAPILFLFEWLVSKCGGLEKAWKHYVHRSYPICRRGSQCQARQLAVHSVATIVLLRAFKRLRFDLCLSSSRSYRSKSFKAKVVPSGSSVENAGASESTPSPSLLNVSIRRRLFVRLTIVIVNFSK